MVDTSGKENDYILAVDTFVALAPIQNRVFGALLSLGNVSPCWPYALIIVRITRNPERLRRKCSPFRSPRI